MDLRHSRKIEELVHNISWFELYDRESYGNTLLFDTKLHGDEELGVGREDIQEALRLWDIVENEFRGKIKCSMEIIGPYVLFYVNDFDEE